MLIYVLATKDSNRKTGYLTISLEKTLFFQIKKYIVIGWVIMNTCEYFSKVKYFKLQSPLILQRTEWDCTMLNRNLVYRG